MGRTVFSGIAAVLLGGSVLAGCGVSGTVAESTSLPPSATTSTTTTTTVVSATTTTQPGFSGVDQLIYPGADGTISLNLVYDGDTITGSGYIGPGTVAVSGATAVADCGNPSDQGLRLKIDGCIVCSTASQAEWAGGGNADITVTGKVIGSTTELTLTVPGILGSGGNIVVTLGPGTGGPAEQLLWPDGAVYTMDDVLPRAWDSPAFVATVDGVSETC